jgi:hypothetical protein
MSPVYKKSFTIQPNQSLAYKSVVVRRINEAIKINIRLKNENKKIEKKSGTNFAIEIIEEQERKEKRREGDYGWGKIKNKSGKRK